MSGDMVTCKVCGFVGYPREVERHKPYCHKPKPWTVVDCPGFSIVRNPKTGMEALRVKR
jgi:hypothetical protein